MANPAPTINQINAFNATQGTTIDFNIIGGTELVRSNRIYIYDLSDNSLICTHLYVSTESIHELPVNTDSSIVYESGKSSADFVNGAQYYAQIQTFTDIAGTEGGSGLSVAKMFWCLVDPTLTITTIPSTISTTSYNVSATYNANTSVVSNIIQQYQFSLYSATGSLLQSSGVVVGSGAQQGTSTTYDISYNFTGLSVGSSYYVVVDVTTTQGMSVSVQSNTFTVSIDTPTLGEATVVNNACDGYISVTSNLSGEYGGSGSGEIVSFETDSENVFTKLQVDLEPVQDLNGYDAPWVGGAGKNKLSIPEMTDSSKGVTITATSEPKLTFNGTRSGSATFVNIATGQSLSAGTYILNGGESGDAIGFQVYNTTQNIVYRDTSGNGVSFTVNEGDLLNYRVYIGENATATNMVRYPMIRLSSESDASWQPYENICPISGHDSVNVYRSNKNLVRVARYYNLKNGITYTENADGTVHAKGTASAESLSAGNPISDYANSDTRCLYTLPSGQYTIKNISGGRIYCQIIKADLSANIQTKSLAVGSSVTVTLTEPSIIYIRLDLASGTVIDADINVTVVKGTTALSTYVPWECDTYTTALGRTVYGGTLDVVSGVLTVTHKIIDLGSLTWNVSSNGKYYTAYNGTIENEIKRPSSGSELVGCICSCYVEATTNTIYNGTGDGEVGVRYSNGNLWVRDTVNGTSGANLKTFLNGKTLCYELATPQTYQLTPQQIQTLVGVNNVWSEQGDVELSYHIPITNLLVKRQDVGDVSGDWLTLYSQPITQASDMDFTFIDFTNQYGKTYKYALVPLLTQTQSGVEVEVEGGYTVSDEVQSIFDGVFIADSTGSQKCKANVGYGNVDMNQVVGSITPIGAKYPIIITNSQNQYHNGSISGTIVPDDYYFNGNLSRIDMVNKRDELEQFLTNKRAKIIKDWNGNIWLVMIMDNVSCTFNNNYGMGIVNFSTSWVEVGDPTNQQDLQATGLINVGGV